MSLLLNTFIYFYKFSEWEKFISGVILYEETLGQKNSHGVLFAEVLQKKGIIPGIKVDKVKKYIFKLYSFMLTYLLKREP